MSIAKVRPRKIEKDGDRKAPPYVIELKTPEKNVLPVVSDTKIQQTMNMKSRKVQQESL